MHCSVAWNQREANEVSDAAKSLIEQAGLGISATSSPDLQKQPRCPLLIQRTQLLFSSLLFATQLLTREVDKRLGTQGAASIRSHIFFADVVWTDLLKCETFYIPLQVRPCGGNPRQSALGNVPGGEPRASTTPECSRNVSGCSTVDEDIGASRSDGIISHDGVRGVRRRGCDNTTGVFIVPTRPRGMAHTCKTWHSSTTAQVGHWSAACHSTVAAGSARQILVARILLQTQVWAPREVERPRLRLRGHQARMPATTALLHSELSRHPSIAC